MSKENKTLSSSSKAKINFWSRTKELKRALESMLTILKSWTFKRMTINCGREWEQYFIQAHWRTSRKRKYYQFHVPVISDPGILKYLDPRMFIGTKQDIALKIPIEVPGEGNRNLIHNWHTLIHKWKLLLRLCFETPGFLFWRRRLVLLIIESFRISCLKGTLLSPDIR